MANLLLSFLLLAMLAFDGIIVIILFLSLPFSRKGWWSTYLVLIGTLIFLLGISDFGMLIAFGGAVLIAIGGIAGTYFILKSSD